MIFSLRRLKGTKGTHWHFKIDDKCLVTQRTLSLDLLEVDLGEAHGLFLGGLAEIFVVAVAHALVTGVAEAISGTALDVRCVGEDLFVIVVIPLGLFRRTGNRVVLKRRFFELLNLLNAQIEHHLYSLRL